MTSMVQVPAGALKQSPARPQARALTRTMQPRRPTTRGSTRELRVRTSVQVPVKALKAPTAPIPFKYKRLAWCKFPVSRENAKKRLAELYRLLSSVDATERYRLPNKWREQLISKTHVNEVANPLSKE